MGTITTAAKQWIVYAGQCYISVQFYHKYEWQLADNSFTSLSVFGKIIRHKTVTQKTHKHSKLSTSENKKHTSSSAQMEEEFSLTDLPFTTASQSRCQEGLIYKTIGQHGLFRRLLLSYVQCVKIVSLSKLESCNTKLYSKIGSVLILRQVKMMMVVLLTLTLPVCSFWGAPPTISVL